MFRRVLFQAAVGLAIAGLSGCGGDDYQRIHRSARNVLPVAVEMEEGYGSADHAITHFGLRSQKTNTWNTEVFFGGRYELTMQVEVKVKYAEGQIEIVGEPKFFLTETRIVNVTADGRVEALHGKNFIFSKDDWKKVYEKHGDFTAIGLDLNPDPVPNFDKYVAEMRRPRIAVSLLEK
jgi:hypothetical protein